MPTTATKNSIIDIPVTISGFIIGMFVTERTAFFANLFFMRWMPAAAAVPMTVASAEEQIARTSVFRRAANVSGERKSSRYHRRLKPVKTAVLFEALKEKKISVMIGM